MARKSGGSDFSFDSIDRAYRDSSVPDVLANTRKGYDLQTHYNIADHRYEFYYRGHKFCIDEVEIMWDRYPMNILAERIKKIMKEINGKEDFGWKPKERSLSHSEILNQLERYRSVT